MAVVSANRKAGSYLSGCPCIRTDYEAYKGGARTSYQLDYYFPGDEVLFPGMDKYDKALKNLTANDRLDLCMMLRKKTEDQMEQFGIKRESCSHELRYPLPVDNQGMEIKILLGRGKHVGFGRYVGGIACLSEIRDAKEAILGFNRVSDYVEELDRTVIAPRIELGQNVWIANYPLRSESFGIADKERLIKLVDNMPRSYFKRLGGLLRIECGKDSQSIYFGTGDIMVGNGKCIAMNFHTEDVPIATAVVSALIDGWTFDNDDEAD